MYFIKVLSGFLTPTIAVLTAYIAYRQYKTDKNKLKFDLYEKRFNLFSEFKSLLFKINEDGKIDRLELRDFKFKTIECNFLFGSDIWEFRNALIEKSLRITQLNERIPEEMNDPQKLEELQTERKKISLWCDSKYENIEKTFYKYLDFGIL